MNILYQGNILVNDVPVTQAAEHEEEMMKSDFVLLSWNSAEYLQLPVDAYIVPFSDGIEYRLLEPYDPEQKSECEWHYEPHFQHPKMYLGKVPFTKMAKDSDGNDFEYLEWAFTGFVGSLLQYFCDTINTALGIEEDKFGYTIVGDIEQTVSTSFSSVDVLSALSNIANVEKCEWHIDWEQRTLYFGHIIIDRLEPDIPVLEVGVNVGIPSARDSREGYWNAFLAQGSTRNITRRAVTGEDVQSNVRLTLDKTKYPDGIIYTDSDGNVIPSLSERRFVKSLIFESVFPKLDLYVYDVRCRERYYEDDSQEGTDKRVVDHYESDGTPVYKRYAVWYMRLAYPDDYENPTRWTDYSISNRATAKVTSFNVYVVRDGDTLLGYGYGAEVALEYSEDIFTGTPTTRGGVKDYPVSLFNGKTSRAATASRALSGDTAIVFGELKATEAEARDDADAIAFIGKNATAIDFDGGIDLSKIPTGNIKSDIIAGKSLYGQWKANTYKKPNGSTYEYAETSPLAGRGDGDDGNYGFGLIYHENDETIPADSDRGDTGVEIKAGDYEVVFQQSGDYILPTTASQGIIPKGVKVNGNEVTDLNSLSDKSEGLKGNIVNLYNIVMSDDYVASAQEELERETLKSIANLFKDNNSYTFKSNPFVFHTSKPNLYIGRSVIYRNGSYELSTRVMKLVTKLDFDFEQEITVGNEVLKGAQQTLKEQMQTIISGGAAGGSGGVSNEQVQRIVQNWVTPRFLSKLSDDEAQGVITFLKGLWVKAKGLFGIDEEGNGIFNTISALSGIINSIESGNYDGDGTIGSGWKLTNEDGNGNSSLTVDNLYVRMKAVFNELEVRKMVHTAGNYIFSPAGSIIEQVDYLDAEGNPLGYEAVKVPWVLRLVPLSLRGKLLSRTKPRKVNTLSEADKAKVATFRCWVLADDGTTQTINTWRIGMLARCETFNIKSDGEQKHANDTDKAIYNEVSSISETAAGNTFYWRKVVGVGEGESLYIDDGKEHNYVDLSNVRTEYLNGSDWPSAGDSIVCYGVAAEENEDGESLVEYSNLVVIETVGGDAPAIKEYLRVGLYDDNRSGINWSLSGKMRTKISPRTGNVFKGEFFVQATSGGNTTYTDINSLIDSKVSEFQVTIDGITATVKRILNNNILTGVLDGRGWIGENATTASVTSDNGIYGSGNKLYSPLLYLDKHKQYVVSFYYRRENISDLRVYVNNGDGQDWEDGLYQNQEEVTVREANETAKGLTRYYFTIGQPAEYGATWIYFYGATASSSIYYPQVEEGTELSPFSAQGIEIGSRITQTAEQIRSEVANTAGTLRTEITQTASSINASVQNIADGLAATGINIADKEITMTADKFTLNNNNGEQVLGTDENGNLEVSGIVHASGGDFTGTVHATDGDFTGIVHTKLAYSDVKVINNSYTVDPTEAPYTFYLISISNGNTVNIELPAPGAYEGLEISFYKYPQGSTRLSMGGTATISVADGSYIQATTGERSMFGKSGYEWVSLGSLLPTETLAIPDGQLFAVKAMDGRWEIISRVVERAGAASITKSVDNNYGNTGAGSVLTAENMTKKNLFQLTVNTNTTVTLPSETDVANAFGWENGLPSDFAYRFTIVVNYASTAQLTVKTFKGNNGSDSTHQMAKGDTLELLCSMYNGFHYQLLWYNN